MRTAGLKRLCIVAGLVGLVTACGGAGDADTQGFSVPLKGGIWHGSDAATGVTVYGIVAETGEFQFLSSNGTQWVAQYSGGATFDHTAIVGSFEAFTYGGTTFPDGSVHGMGSFGGLMNPGNSMDVDVAIHTDISATPVEDSLQLTFDNSYRTPSSLGRIGGSFGAGTDTLQVFGDGTLFGQFPASGCTVTGNVEISDPQHNVYKIKFTFTCSNAAFNGDQSGLATLDDSATPQRLVGAVGATGKAFVFTLNRL